jgi:ketosteroid isomerase-like protein
MAQQTHSIPSPLSLETSTQHHSIAEKFLLGWRSGNTISTADFSKVYTPDVVWFDHFFQLHLVGTAAVDQLRQRWCGAMDDLSIDTVAILPTAEGAVAQVINRGIFARDMLPKRKATGKRYACHACYVLRINAEGLVERVDEYQTMAFDDGVDIEGYSKRDGGPVKDLVQ